MTHTALPQLPYVTPPRPRGAGGKAGGFSANGWTNTELGDRVERAIARQWEIASDLPPGKRQGEFDLRTSDRLFEVKAVTVQSSEFKMKPRKAEVDRKLLAAKRRRMKPTSIIAVVNGKRALIYWREGIGAFRLTSAWHYAGTVTL